MKQQARKLLNKATEKERKIFIKNIFRKKGFNIKKHNYRFALMLCGREEELEPLWRKWKSIEKQHIADKAKGTHFVSECCNFLTEKNWVDKEHYTVFPRCMNCGKVGIEVII